MSGISQGMGRKNVEMGKAHFRHFSVLKMGKVRRLLKKSLFFSTTILGEDYKNVVFPRCVVKDICIQLARYIDSRLFLPLLLNISGPFFGDNV